MRALAQLGFLTATEVADELVRRGVSFAEAHEQVGKLVRHAAERHLTFADLTPAEARKVIPGWDSTLHAIATSPEEAVRRRKVIGGTAPAQVARQLARAERVMKRMKRQWR
jgi:argininosuccinate lyase